MDINELLLLLQNELDNVTKEDEQNLSGLDEHEEDLDRAWRIGFARAVELVKEQVGA
jgi:hypothetical protein